MALLDFFTRRSDGRAAPALQPLTPPVKPLTAAQKAAGSIIGIIGIALAGVYVNEGGYVNDPADRGGATRFGVTQKVARAAGYTGAMRDFPKHCDAAHPVCADLIYTRDYIDKPGFRPMAAVEPAVFYEMVDSAVLHGQGRASGWFVGAVNGVCRTKFPPATSVKPVHVEAYSECARNLGAAKVCVRVLDAMDAGQRQLFDRIVARDPSQRRFYKGWTTQRIGNVDRRKCGGRV